MLELSQAAGGAVGEDALEKLEAALRPVEKYAVRFLEEVSSIVLTWAASSIRCGVDTLHGCSCIRRSTQRRWRPLWLRS